MRTAGEILKNNSRDVIYVSPTMTVFDALASMAEQNIGAVLVLDEGRLVGIFSERDYARKVILNGRTSASTLVRDVMVQDLITIQLTATLTDCMQLMTDHHIRHLPVFSDSTLIGVLSIGDVVRHVIDEQRHLIEQLEAYIRG